MALDAAIEALLETALSAGGDFAEIYCEQRGGTSIVTEGRRIEKFLASDESGVGIRVVQGEMGAYAYTNDMQALDELARSVARAIRQGGRPATVALAARTPRSFVKSSRDPLGVQATDKIALLQRAEETAWKSGPDVAQVKVVYGDGQRRVQIANSLGFSATDERTSVIMAVQGVLHKDERMETGYETLGGARGLELFEETSPEELALTAMDRARRSIDARHAPAGSMPVVLSCQAGGTMVHEAIGHGLEADLAGEGLSVYSDRIGQQVASPAISVVDDGTLPGLRGSMGHDDEGTPTGRTVLVENGILRTYLTDLVSARKLGLPLSGNGRRESYRHRPLPRMTNTLITPGSEAPEAIVARVSRGLFVQKMGGGQVNTVNGDFVFEVAEGYAIRDGSIGEPLRGATLIGNGPRILLSIEHVANDMGYAIGTCGKDGQGVAVADGQPTLLIPEITVGGRSA